MIKRRIKKAHIRRIALVPRGANRMPVLYKSDDSQVTLEPLSKLDDEKGELTAVVYPANYTDSQGHFADAEAVREMAHDFVKNGAELDLRHGEKALTKEQAHLAQTFIVQKGDPRFADWKDYQGEAVDLADAWAVVLKISDPELRKLYREGKWNGVSMAGPALLEDDTQKSAAPVDEFLDAITKRLAGATPDPEEIDMNADEMKTLLAESNKELAKSITEGLAAALKPATPATPVTKADEEIDIATETDPKKLFAYAKQRRIQALKEEFDLPNADADDIVEFQKELALIEAEFAEKAASTRRTRKPASKQPAADAETVAELFSQGLSKEEIDLAKEGLSIGKMANEMAGRS